jgi:AcrR family transcriptional regulator
MSAHGASPPVSRDRVLDAAMDIVERDGVEGLTMRRLASDLGVAPTAIYWHVGNRHELLGELVDRIIDDVGAVAPSGRTPTTRIVSIARALRSHLLERPHLVGLVNEHGRTAVMFLPAQSALARELSTAGLPAKQAAMLLRSVLFCVVGFVLLEINMARSPEQHPTTEDLWRARADLGIDPALRARLAAGFAITDVFEFTLRSVLHQAL